jgi:hypothetical protein
MVGSNWSNALGHTLVIELIYNGDTYQNCELQLTLSHYFSPAINSAVEKVKELQKLADSSSDVR